jgi:hypothetical protein
VSYYPLDAFRIPKIQIDTAIEEKFCYSPIFWNIDRKSHLFCNVVYIQPALSLLSCGVQGKENMRQQRSHFNVATRLPEMMIC